MKKRFNEGNQIHNFMSSSGSGTVINYGSGSDFFTSYGSGSGSTSQKVTVPTVPVLQHCPGGPKTHESGECGSGSATLVYSLCVVSGLNSCPSLKSKSR
jgi:hypothetical protein